MNFRDYEHESIYVGDFIKFSFRRAGESSNPIYSVFD